MVLRGHLSLLDATVGMIGHFVPLIAWRDHWDKRVAFLLASDSQYPHSTACRMSFGMSWESLSDSHSGYALRNWKNLTLKKA